MTTKEALRLKAMIGDYPITAPLKKGEVCSDLVSFDFAEVKVAHDAFKRTVRELEFDVSELAIVTYLMAKARGKPLVLLPAAIVGRFQHPFIVYNAERGHLAPGDLAGKRVGVRSYSVTTVTWIRGILQNDYGVDLDRVKWVTFEEGHVAEYRDPPTAVRAPAGKDITQMLLDGELDAAVLGATKDARLKPLIPDPDAAARDWHRRNGAVQLNHVVVVKESLSRSNPRAVAETYRLLAESKGAAGLPKPGDLDPQPFGVTANRRNLEVAIEYCHQQRLIPRKLGVDDLFDDVTRNLG